MDDLLAKLKEIEQTLTDAVEGVATAETLLLETGSNVPNTQLWNGFRAPTNEARQMTRALVMQLEALEKAGQAA